MRTFGLLTLVLIIVGPLGCMPFDVEGTKVDELSRTIGQVQTIGDLGVTLGDEFSVFLDVVPWQGATDVPYLIAGDAVDTLTEAQRSSIAAAYDATLPIMLIDATAAQINALMTIIGEQGDYALDSANDRVEFFGIDQEADGSSWTTMSQQPAAFETHGYDADDDGVDEEEWTENVVDTRESQELRAMYIMEWIAASDARSNDAAAAKTRGGLMQAAEAAELDLQTLARQYSDEQRFTHGKNHYVINTYSLVFTDRTNQNDYILITQDCRFNAEGEYWTKTGHQPDIIKSSIWGHGYGWYLREVEVDTWLNGFKGSSSVQLLKDWPNTSTTTESLTKGFEFGLSAGVEYSKKDGIGASLGADAKWSESRSITIEDFTILNRCKSDWNNAKWSYEFKQPALLKRCCPAVTYAPAPVSRSTFSTSHLFVIRTADNAYNRRPSLAMTIKVTLQKCQADWWKDSVDRRHKTYQSRYDGDSTGSAIRTIPVRYVR